MRRVFTVAAGAIVCLAAGGAWNDVDIKSRPVVQERVESVGGEAASLLPPGKKWKIVGGNGWNGYGADSKWYGHFAWDYEECEGGWCYYGVDWTPKGYTFYANGKKVGEQNSPVSHVEQFILVSTEPRGYRNVAGNDGGLSEGRREWGKPAPELFDAVLPDFFEVDFVRVYDEVSASAGADSRGGHP